MNPQGLNRYSYVNNNPIMFTDPTGHCAGVRGNPNSDNYDTVCWEFLENGDFCGIVDCGTGDWTNWLLFFPFQNFNNQKAGSFLSPWTVQQLTEVATRIQHTIGAFAGIGVDWKDTNLSNTVFSIGEERGTSYNRGKRAITMTASQLINGRTIYHEIGHSIPLEYEFEGATNGGCLWIFCKPNAAPGHYFREYGLNGKSSTYSPIQSYFARPGETWADAFSVFVYHSVHGAFPTQAEWQAVDTGFVTNMSTINDAATNVLKAHYGVP